MQIAIAILLKPGETATLDFALPHGPLPIDRARRLLEQDFDARHAECRQYWTGKFAAAAKARIPERRITEMVRSGLAHLDTIIYGIEPDETLAPNVGVYAPIGTESAPIIQFMDSMGLHDVARRCLGFFLDTQHDDGFIQNYSGYELETQAFLWCASEHYKYHPRRRVGTAGRATDSCGHVEYLGKWRERNLREDLRGKGYGLLEGRVADPIEPYRYFMANAYFYAGLHGAVQMLRRVDPAESRRLGREAAAVREDVRNAFFEATARSPVIPIGDGTWCPTSPAWADAGAPAFMLLDDHPVHTHGSFVSRDSLIGPSYLIFLGVIDADEPEARRLMQYQSGILYNRNCAFSQPYYSPHAWYHLKRGEVKAFLKTYYNTFSALSDRDTYSFWEHFYHCTPPQDTRGSLVSDAHTLDAVYGRGRHSQAASGDPQSVDERR